MISIVMSHYNRLPLLRHSLKTISTSKEKEFEVIVVDDFSSPEHKLNGIEKEFPNLNIKLIDMADVYERKTYCNPCVPFNIGFNKSIGDTVVIQNPECCHMGDVITFVKNNINDEDYLVFNCYGSSKEDLEKIHNNVPLNITATKKKSANGYWYNHGVYRPKGYHFTSAISRNNLKKLNGFDERFSMGNSYDDDEFLHRIKVLGLNLKFISNPWVIHQWHDKMTFTSSPKATVDNKLLYQEIKKEQNVKANNQIDIG